jgi:hypothetical protein
VTPAEAREVAADLTDDTPTIMPDGRMRNLQGPQWRPAGVHRKGVTTLQQCPNSPEGIHCACCEEEPGHRCCYAGPDDHCGRGELEEGAVLADVHWFETATEWFERSPPP